LHLILAHIPVVGMMLSLTLLGYGAWRRDPRARQIALAGVALSGLIAIPVYFTGEGAEEAVEELAGVAEAAVERHEEAARVAAILMALAGALAAWSAFRSRKGAAVPRGLVASVTAAGIVAFGAIGYTANLGGQIRHTEIASGNSASAEQQGGTGAEGSGGSEDEGDDEDEGAARHAFSPALSSSGAADTGAATVAR
jgi:uncharacterized membrane protein